MKNLFKVTVIACICLFVTSCNKDDDSGPKQPTVNSSVKSVDASGEKKEGKKLTAKYALNGTKKDVTFQWYTSAKANGTKATKVSGATKKEYTVKTADVGKFLAVQVAIKGASKSAKRSKFVGPMVKK